MQRPKRKSRPIKGEMLGKDEPNWEPLVRLARVYIDEFMWMSAVELADGTELQAYKNYWTRRYIHLDDSGHAFCFIWKRSYDTGEGADEPSEYREIPEEELPRFFDRVIERPDPSRGIPRYTYWVKKVMVSMPAELLAEVDGEARRLGSNRSAVLRGFAERALSSRRGDRARAMEKLLADAGAHGGDAAERIKASRPDP
jgi:hypothetical protein